MNTQPKITIKKRGRVWEVDCPHCLPFGSFYIDGSFTDAVAFTSEHLGTHYSTHHPYIAWPRADGVPVARCHTCDWANITEPFRAVTQHLKESK